MSGPQPADDPRPAFEPPIRRVRWSPCYRIVPSRFPPIDLFERVADPADYDAVFAVEALTNARLRDQTGQLELVAPRDRVSGPGASWLMAPFTHVSAPGGRFSTPAFGAFYAARSLDTAIAETKYHRGRFLRATAEPPMEIDMRVLNVDLEADLHDVRGLGLEHPELYHLSDYSASQALAQRLREGGSWGVVYDSVRDPGGECVAVLRPRVLSNCRQAQHLAYLWDGSNISQVYQKTLLGGG
jgi:hypothetical protein